MSWSLPVNAPIGRRGTAGSRSGLRPVEIRDAVLTAARRQGLVTVRGRAGTDSTHVLSAAVPGFLRELNQLRFDPQFARG